MSDNADRGRIQQLERQVQSLTKRIAELEAKYLALLEDLKIIRVELSRKSNAERPLAQTNDPASLAEYQARFDRWPGNQR